MKINNCDLNKNICIIAEIGNNHEGNFNTAQKMISEAAACGVDAVKFQTFRTEHYVSRNDTARFERLKSFELTDGQFKQLAQDAKDCGLLFISTPFDLESVDVLKPLVDAFKISSGDNTFFPLIERVSNTGKPVIISSGLIDIDGLKQTVNFVKDTAHGKNGGVDLAVLHCVSSYPVPPEEANLKSICYLENELDCLIGYSDHTNGIAAASLAVASGARIIEKHFTLDKNYSDFRDHQLSADPADMKELVIRCREALLMLGEAEKIIQSCEKDGLSGSRRSIAANSDMEEGRVISESDLTWIRPGGGFKPGDESLLIGKTLKRAVGVGQVFEKEDLN
jgi:N,N'-diacetyllegionaminate synthase